jgi:hypothetical protein
MIRFQAGRLAALLGPMVLLAACGGSGVNHATRDLEDRLQTRLGPDISAGQAVLQPLPAGARVTLPDPTEFTSGGAELSDKGRDVLASTIQGLLDPSLMRIEVADTAVAPDGPRSTRVQAVRQYFLAYGLGPSLQPPGQPPAMQPASAGPPATGLAVTINVQCPSHRPPAGDDSAQPQASCN